MKKLLKKLLKKVGNVAFYDIQFELQQQQSELYQEIEKLHKKGLDLANQLKAQELELYNQIIIQFEALTKKGFDHYSELNSQIKESNEKSLDYYNKLTNQLKESNEKGLDYYNKLTNQLKESNEKGLDYYNKLVNQLKTQELEQYNQIKELKEKGLDHYHKLNTQLKELDEKKLLPLTYEVQNTKSLLMIISLTQYYDLEEASTYAMMQDILRYERQYGTLPNLFIPTTFIDKLFYRKYIQSYHHAEYAILADKYRVRSYVEEKIGAEHLIPLLNFFESVEELAQDIQKNRHLYKNVVIKANHSWNMTYFITDTFTDEQIMTLLSHATHWLSVNHSLRSYEPHYHNIKPGIIVEQMIGKGIKDNTSQFSILDDYRIYAFRQPDNSMQYLIHLTSRENNQDQEYRSYYLNNLNECYIDDSLSKIDTYQQKKLTPDLHLLLSQMLILSDKLLSGIDFARIDWYYDNEKIFFSEFTLTPAAGRMPRKFFPPELMKHMSEMWHLDSSLNK
ncbi:ATP-grasp fold amidoligase family protein [Entomospira nematocerorum]|uniref:Uncharacterized protein n=1 Tax=Entomospira nematocerorum TaxID=2719987 RepID=A0A968GC80_9SPIO|nr:ATP-grasp fold amidoligase family protein [Entomospira nematocera]NIZ46748.1 hypothetical protein [Entomospira nematocera]WDI33455.1 ATP-grasp fold amidoligase family protein [Entomospira nematocera]